MQGSSRRRRNCVWRYSSEHHAHESHDHATFFICIIHLYCQFCLSSDGKRTRRNPRRAPVRLLIESKKSTKLSVKLIQKILQSKIHTDISIVHSNLFDRSSQNCYLARNNILSKYVAHPDKKTTCLGGTSFRENPS